MLTRQQLALLRFIHERLREDGVPPSFDEMKDALDLKSKSGIHRLLIGLEERGFIRRLPNRARAVEVLRLPAAGDVRGRGCTPVVVEGGLGRRAAAAPGTPVSSIRARTATIEVPPDYLGAGEHFALEVRGDSMIEAGILHGDTAIFRRQDRAGAGDIVLAVIDGAEAALKRYRRRGSSVALESASSAYETRVLGPERIEIKGNLVALIRRYTPAVSGALASAEGAL